VTLCLMPTLSTSIQEHMVKILREAIEAGTVPPTSN